MEQTTPTIQMNVNISLYQPGYGGTLRIEEQVELPAADFLELAKILGQFHDLAKKIKAEKAEKR